MKRLLTGLGILTAGAVPALAGGIERTPQALGVLFEKGNYVELTFGGVDPDISGRDFTAYGGSDTGDVGHGFGLSGIAYKHDFTDKLSGAFIMERPYGADIRYDAFPGGSLMLGGTEALVDSTRYTAILRYRFDDSLSFHAGIRGSHADGEVSLGGLAYGPVSGYHVDLDDTWWFGWLAGVAYEIPELAARISLTYNSPIEHDFDTNETLGGAPLGPESETTVRTPRSWVVEGQTGVSPTTLVFASIRWVNWSEFRLDPDVFVALTGSGLVELEDTTTYTIGVGHKFTDAWSGAASISYEPEGDDDVSPLAPTNGHVGITLAAIYTRDRMKVTTAVNYTKLGDAYPSPGGNRVAEMSDNHAWGAGVRIGYSF